ncbi:S6 family peptidase [uncultured Helicobacter sp.]|uniref:S6 family peptidase n=1 Tax=uncultured Helicobacter sp. TaxID=175537 RepID=UPI0025D07D39|nr:S6 family peptidase [uncultured Helicobacter sp.]
MRYANSRKFGVAIVLSATLISGLNAQTIHLDKFFYRDFLDLGQNKGAFSAGAENVVIHSSKTPGVSMSFEAPIIDQSARSNNGNSTALGRHFVITATHVAGSSGSSTDSLVNALNPEMRRWGQTSYSISEGSKSQNYGYDVTFTRFNKYIVEGETEIFDAGLKSDNNNSTNDKAQEAENLQKLKEYLEKNKDSNGNLTIFQAGSGRLSLINAPGGGFNNAGIAQITGTRGGSFSRPIDFDRITYEDSKANQNVDARGIQLLAFTNLAWYNSISPGDSGSGFFIYDNDKKKWVLLGVTSKAQLVSGGGSGIAVATKADFEKYKKEHEQEIDLKNASSNGKLTLNNASLSNGITLQHDKDIIFKSGGDIEVTQNIYRNNSGYVGGFVFKAKEGASADKPTTYKITSGTQSNGKPFGFDGAGLDIDENVKVEWGLGFIEKKNGVNDALHKVGKGTLEIVTPKDSIQGYLRVGDGKVIFNTEHQVFKGVYLTSGRATLELTKDKAQAFGAVKVDPQLDSKLPHHFKLEQNNKDSLGIYFGNGGGNLDLKGNSLTLNTISSNDSRANIINTDTDGNNPSYITIEGYGYDKDKKKTQNKADTIIHASFGQSTDSKNDNSKTNGNLNLIYKGDTTDINDKDKAALVFDGNVNAKGLQVDDGKVVLQGHPTTHAYIRNQDITTNLGVKNFLELVKKAEGNKLPDWMDLSRPSTLEQPDWDHRVFKIGTIDLKESRLDVGREATLEGKIKADSSSAINFGGDIEHYIDKKDGENTTGNGFEYQQEAEKAKLEAETQKIANQTIHFKGEIDADGTKINSSIYDFNAKLDLKNNAKLNADFLTLDRETHKTGAILAMNNSTAEVKNLIFKGLTGTANDVVNIDSNSKLNVTESLGFESSQFDLDKLSSIGNGNFTKPTNYDLFVKDKSNITGTNTAITGNVGVMNESSLTLQSITLKDTTPQGQESKPENIKNSILVVGQKSSLNVSGKISSTSQDNTLIVVNGFRETTGAGTRDIVNGVRQEVIHEATLSTTGGIELEGTKAYGLETKCSGDKSGVGCFDDESMQGKISNIVLTTGGKIESDLKATNLQLNVNVDKDSSFLGSGKTLESNASSVALNFELGGEKEQEFNIDAKQKSHITLTAHAKEALAKDTAAFEKALESSQYKGKITADNGSQIDSNLSNITASVDLKNGASLNVANGGILTLKDSLNSIKLDGKDTALNVGTIVAESLSNLTLNVGQDSKFNVTNFVFKGGSVSNERFYGENVWLQDQASVTLKGSEGIQHNLYVSGDSTFKMENDKALKIDKEGETKIQTEIGSKLEINKLEADKKSNVYIALDLEKLDSNPKTKQVTQSQQKNFDIDAKGGSNVYVNVWDMNRQGFNNGDTKLTTDADSRIHFGILKHNMANKNYIESPIKANLSISQSLTLESVGKPTASGGNKVAQNSVNAGAMSRDITSESAKTPTNQTFSESDPLKLQAQAGTNDDRFHALKLEGNTMGSNGEVQNTGKNLTLGDGTRIEVKLDSSIKAESSGNGNGDFQLNKYYTLISAGSITDNRTDKRIYFTFADGNTPLYWVTIVENGEVKVKFTKEDPSSYNELKNYINDDKLLEILIQHNPKNDFVQMAGTANQHKELDGYLGVLNKDMEHIAKNTEMNISEKVLLANDQSINTRIAQSRYAQSRFALSPIKLASNDEKDVALALGAIKSMREKNSAWLSMGAGAFMQGGDNKANLSFYSTNVGYDRLFNIGDDELIFGVMAGFGGSNYSASSLSDNAMVMNLGLYGLYQTGKHEIQSNLSVSSISGDRSVQGILGGEKAKADSLGLLSHSYYKYRFLLKETDSFESMLKPVGLFSIGYNGIGEYRGTNYAQQAFNAFNVGLGAGVEYALVGKKTSYTFSLLAKQNVYSSANQVFVTLSNAQNFIGYEINPTALTFQLGFVGTKQFDKGFALQYGLTGMSDIQGGFGGKGDIRLEYKF